MRFFSILLISITIGSSAFAEIDCSNTVRATTFDCRYNKFENLADWSMQWRQKAQATYQNLIANEQIGPKKKNPISKEKLNRIYKSATDYASNRDELYALALSMANLVETPDLIKISTVEGNYNLAAVNGPMTLNPLTVIGQRRLRQIRISLAAGLILYDNYLLAIAAYEKIKDFRVLIESDLRNGQLMLDIARNYKDPAYARMIIEAIRIFDLDYRVRQRAKMLNYSSYKDIAAFEDIRSETLDQIIRQSPTYRSAHMGGLDIPWYDIPLIHTELAMTKAIDKMAQVKNAALFNLSKVVGNAMGAVHISRHGVMMGGIPGLHPFARLTDASLTAKAASIQARLQPMDVLLEKTSWALTDKTIPGHFGHVAIYVGSKQQIISTFGQDFWEELRLIKDKHGNSITDRIEAGASIIEALRPGVQVNSMSHFLNIDDLLAIRPQHLTLQEKKDAMRLSFQQVGKEYDFDFDVETDTRIVCSEIVYATFVDPEGIEKYKWKTNKMLGFYTISPDAVLQSAFETKEFAPVMYYSFGTLVNRSSEDLEVLLKEFIAGDYHQAVLIHGVNPY